jgi:hypothetical protein
MGTLILLAAGTFLAAQAEAVGINLFWDDCGVVSGVTNKNFACNTNDGYQDLYLSVDPPSGVTATYGHNHIIDLQSQHSPLPSWWDFNNSGACRQTELIASAEFSTGPSGGAACADPWQGQGSAGVAAYTTNFNGLPCRARIIGSVAVPEDMAVPMNPGTEYYSVKFRITNARTVGTDLCGDCFDPVCLVFNRVRIAQVAPAEVINVENPLDAYWATWQGALLNTCPGFKGSAYCEPTPVVSRTWGLVKSLYR